jgi:hypothetical protein
MDADIKTENVSEARPLGRATLNRELELLSKWLITLAIDYVIDSSSKFIIRPQIRCTAMSNPRFDVTRYQISFTQFSCGVGLEAVHDPFRLTSGAYD